MGKYRLLKATAIAMSLLIAKVALAGATSAPIIIFLPAHQPGNACIPEGVGTGAETKTSAGDTVLAVGVHGANATRCPEPRFPTLATIEKLPPDEERRLPSARCVARTAKVGDELTIPSYGMATVVALDPANDTCRQGVMAKVVGTALYRASKENSGAGSVTVAPPALPYEPTEQEIRHEYDRLIAAMAPVQEYRVRHILLRSRDDALTALEQVRAGRPFADVAGELTIDTGSKSKGGDLGWNVPTSFIGEFSKAMVALAPAGLAPEPVKTKFGWHVIELLDTKVGKESAPSFAVARPYVAARLKNIHRAANRSVSVPIKAVCRKMVAPVFSSADGAAPIKGTVVAEVRVDKGRVAEILKLSGPGTLHAAVTEALQRYECDQLDRPAIAVQTFEF